ERLRKHYEVGLLTRGLSYERLKFPARIRRRFRALGREEHGCQSDLAARQRIAFHKGNVTPFDPAAGSPHQVQLDHCTSGLLWSQVHAGYLCPAVRVSSPVERKLRPARGCCLPASV